jgi:hypothetical protein
MAIDKFGHQSIDISRLTLQDRSETIDQAPAATRPILRDIRDNLFSLLRAVRLLHQRVSILEATPVTAAAPSSTASLVHQITLANPTTEITNLPGTPPAEGDRLVLILLQDGTGGRAITWNVGQIKSYTEDLSMFPNTRTIFQFVGWDGKWWQIGDPIRELPA